MSGQSLEDAIREAGSPVNLLRNSPARPYTFPVAPEFTNWRDEQRAWQETCALLDQSHHMADLFVSGPDARDLLNGLAVNSFDGFAVDMAKQLVATNADGYVIGDGILFYLDEESFDFVGAHPTVVDWLQFNIEMGKHQVTIERDENSYDRPIGPPRLYRYELQGPAARALMEAVTGGELPKTKFFHMAHFTIAGKAVRALRHGMAGQPGYELFGPWEDGDAVREALVETGTRFGLRLAGSKAYSTANLESGWIPSPLPAVFSGSEMKAFREWRSASRAGSLGGSFYSEDITDYYVTPFDLGYGKIVSFDHSFVGREALERLDAVASRTKVTLVWNPEDVAAVFGSQVRDEVPAKYLDWPKARYALFQSDKVLHEDKVVGLSMDCGYVYNERSMISLATIDASLAEPGTEVVVVWGEEPNSEKPQVERHRQVEIRATVAPCPFVEYARSAYRSGD